RDHREHALRARARHGQGRSDQLDLEVLIPPAWRWAGAALRPTIHHRMLDRTRGAAYGTECKNFFTSRDGEITATQSPRTSDHGRALSARRGQRRRGRPRAA